MSKKQKPTHEPKEQRPQVDLEAFDREAHEYSEKFADMQTSVYQVQASLSLLSNVFEEYTTPTKGMTLDQLNEILGLLNLCHESLQAQDGKMELLDRKFDQMTTARTESIARHK